MGECDFLENAFAMKIDDHCIGRILPCLELTFECEQRLIHARNRAASGEVDYTESEIVRGNDARATTGPVRADVQRAQDSSIVVNRLNLESVPGMVATGHELHVECEQPLERGLRHAAWSAPRVGQAEVFGVGNHEIGLVSLEDFWKARLEVFETGIVDNIADEQKFGHCFLQKMSVKKLLSRFRIRDSHLKSDRHEFSSRATIL